MNKTISPLRDSRHFQEAEFSYKVFSARVDGHHTEKTLVDPNYWVNFCSLLTPGDEIRALADDGTFLARLLVNHIQGTQAHLYILEFTKLGTVNDNLPIHDGYEIKNGGAAGWWIKVKADGSRLFPGVSHKNQSEAIQALNEYVAAL